MHLAVPVALLSASAAALGSNAGPSAVSDFRCRGAIATIVGTAGDDRIVGTRHDDVIVARAGDDLVRAGRGDDKICDNDGADHVVAGAGDDEVGGGNGADHIEGGPGDDWLAGRRGNDRVDGGPGADRVVGELGNDRLRGDSGPDTLGGGPGTDDCRGGSGSDTVRQCETGDRPRNRPPVASDDTDSTSEAAAKDVAVLANDSDPDGDALSVASLDTAGTTGQVTITGGGSGVRYDPAGRFNSLAPGEIATDSFRYSLSGGTGFATVMITIAGVDTAPSAAGDTWTVTEDDPAQMIDVLANDTDPDGGAAKSIQSVTQPPDGTVAIAGGGTALTYEPDPDYCNSPSLGSTDNFTYTLAPGGSSASVAVTVSCENDAPVLSATGSTLGYEEGDGRVPVDGGVTAADIDSANLQGATVEITSGFVEAEDELAFTDQNGITGNYDDSTGTLTLSGASSVANYQTALRSVTYENSSDTPSTATREVSFEVTDSSAADSNTATRDISVSPTNDAPVVTTSPGDTPYTEGDAATTVDGALTVSDPDDTDLEDATVRVSAGFQPGDELVFVDQFGITGTYDTGTGVLTLAGAASPADYQTALRSITYRHTGDNPVASKTIEFVAGDGADESAPATKGIAVTGVNDAPTLDTTGSPLLYSEGDGAVTVDAGLTATDPDSANLKSATVAITGGFDAAEDELAFTDQLGITGSYNSGTGVLTLTPTAGTASVADYQAALRAVTYENSSDNPSTATRTASFQATDASDAPSNTATRDISVGPANDAPVVTTSGGATSYTEGDLGTTVDGALTVTDSDDTDLAGATVRISAGFQPGDELVFVNQSGIAGVYNTGTGVLHLTGTASTADYQTALRSIEFRTSSDNPALVKTVEFVANDGTADGNAATKNLDITRSNDAPTLNTTGSALSYDEGDGAVPVDGGLSATDPDSANLQGATVEITGGFDSAEDELAFTDQLGITGSYNPSTGTLTLSGTASLPDYQTALRSVTYENSSDDPSMATRTVSLQATDAVGAPSNTATRDISISAVNDAPTVATTGGDTPYTEGDPAVPVDGGLTVNDVDDANLEGATVRVSAGFQAGDGLVFVNQLGISGVYNTGTGVLTLTGTASVGDYQTALRSIEYRHTGDSPVASKTVEFVVNDGDNDSAAATKGITVTDTNDGPTINTSGGALAYTENEGPAAIDTGVTVTDADSAQLSGATVAITGDFNSAQDTLAFADQLGITGSYDSGTGVLTLSGTTTVANYQTALRSVTYTNGSDGPSPATRTISFQASDDAPLAGNVATRNITITPTNDPPTAGDDTGTTDEDTVLNVSAPGVLANDTDPDPSDTKTVNELNGSATLTGTSVEGATVTINADGSYSYDPGSTFQGLATGEQATDSFTYTMKDGANAESTATVNITVNGVSDAPTANGDSFNGIGNTGLFVGTSKPAGDSGKEITGSVLANDTDPDTPHASLVAEPVTNEPTSLGGTITVEADGNFTYHPDDADTAVSDTFTYRVCDASPCNSGTVANSTGTLTIPLDGQVWYVKNDTAAGGDGTSDGPFDTLAEAETASGTSDTVFVYDGDDTTTGYDTGFVMNAGERLIGEVNGLTVDPDGGGSLPNVNLHGGTGGAHPTLAANGEDVVELDDGNEVRGLQLDPQASGGGIAGAAGDTGGGTIDDVRVIDTGPAGTQPGLELDGTTGTFNVSNLVVDNSTASGTTSGSQGVRLNAAGTVNFAPAGTVSITTSGASGLDAAGTSMGAGSVFDDIAVSGSGSGGVRLFNTTGTTTLGNGSGADLDLTTTSGATAALTVSNAGTVSVPAGGAVNISATGGPAVDVSGTSGASIDADTVSSTNSATAGISLSGLGTGTFSATGGSIGGASGTAFSVSGGSGNVTYPGNLNNGSGQTAASITNRTGGAVTLSGQLNDTSDAGGGIVVSSNSGGTSVFSNPTKTLNTGAQIAVQFNGGDGHTLTLANGGLDIDTTSGKGIDAAGLGLSSPRATLNVTGSGNTIDTGTGTALTVSSTDIGTSDLTFQRISSNGAQNGIRLNSTGNANGSLVVTGTGASCTSAANCTGGAIQSSAATGVSLTNVPGGASLTRMFVGGSADDGIGGSNVTGLTLDNATVTGNGNVANTGGVHGDHGVDFSDLTGTAAFTSSNVSNNIDSNIVVSNASGALNMNVTGGSYSGASGGMGDGIFVEGTGTGSQNLNVQGPITFSNNVGDHVQHASDGDNTTDSDVTINNAQMSAPAGGGSVLGGGITIVHGGNTVGGSNVDATVTNNTIQNSVIGAIVVGTTGSLANQQIARVDATIQNNTIGATGVAGSGSVQGNGIFVDSNGNSVVRALITGNSVRQWTNRSGIALDVIDGDAEMSATVKNNVFTEPNAAFAGTTTRGMTLQLGTGQPGDSIDACLDIGDPSSPLKNQVFGTGEAPQPDIRYLHEGPGSVVQLAGYSGPGAPSITDIANYLQPRNNLGGTPTVSGTSTASGTTTTSVSSCPQPSP